VGLKPNNLAALTASSKSNKKKSIPQPALKLTLEHEKEHTAKGPKEQTATSHCSITKREKEHSTQVSHTNSKALLVFALGSGVAKMAGFK